jgi:hypothetical protein
VHGAASLWQSIKRSSLSADVITVTGSVFISAQAKTSEQVSSIDFSKDASIPEIVVLNDLNLPRQNDSKSSMLSPLENMI